MKKLRAQFAAAMEAAKAKARQVMTLAETESREFTEDERNQVNAALAEAKEYKSKIDRLDGDHALLGELEGLATAAGPIDTGAPAGHAGQRIGTIGRQFVGSPVAAWLRQTAGARGQGWTSPSFEAVTLTEDATSGGDLITTDYRPGVVDLRFNPYRVADLLAPGSTDSNSVTYMQETVFTNNAAAVAEGGAKPESALVYDQIMSAVKKIAHWLPTTDEMLEDFPAIRSFIDARLSLGLDLKEDDQLLNGSGVGANMLGIMNVAGLHAAQAIGADTAMDAIFKQMMALLADSFIMPDGIVMNPTNWTKIALAKDSTGQYLGNGPFASMQAPVLWGQRLAITPTIAAGTALVGAFKTAAQIFRKGGTRIDVSNSHADFFTKNLTAIRAEKRLALAVYRPGAIGAVTGLP